MHWIIVIELLWRGRQVCTVVCVSPLAQTCLTFHTNCIARGFSWGCNSTVVPVWVACSQTADFDHSSGGVTSHSSFKLRCTSWLCNGNSQKRLSELLLQSDRSAIRSQTANSCTHKSQALWSIQLFWQPFYPAYFHCNINQQLWQGFSTASQCQHAICGDVLHDHILEDDMLALWQMLKIHKVHKVSTQLPTCSRCCLVPQTPHHTFAYSRYQQQCLTVPTCLYLVKAPSCKAVHVH